MVKSLEHKRAEDLHYSGVFTLSHRDAQTIKDLFIETINQTLKTVAPSEEETCQALTLDFFNLENNESR